MPAALSYPGVYIEELPSGVHTITGVATSIAAFVGYTRKGIPDQAVAITSFADFERQYGGLDRDSPLSYAVRQFFLNGGTQALIVRVSAGADNSKWTLKDSSATDVLDIEAASPGTWGNSLQIRVETSATVPPPDLRNPDADFNLVVSQFQPDGATLIALETYRSLSMDSQSPRYVESVINNASATIQAMRSTGLGFTQTGFALSTNLSGLTFPLSSSDWVVGGALDDATPFMLMVADGASSNGITDLVNAVNTSIQNASLNTRLVASESGADGTPGTGFLKLTSVVAAESSSVVITGGAPGGLARTIGLGLANGGREFPGAVQRRPAAVPNVGPSTAGVDGSKDDATALLGDASSKSGIYALLDVDLFNVLCIPETYDLSDTDAAGLIPFAAALCEQRRAFYIVDVPSTKDLTNVATWANGVSQSRNAATYFPAVKISDPLNSMSPTTMAPSGTVAGVYARTDATRGVWKAPAGTDATLNGVLDLAATMNDVENGNINIKGVNALRNFPAYGRVVWGARTMKGADAQADDYKYIPVRRLALFLEESLYRGTQWVVFEPNDEPLWSQIRLNIGSFMQTLFRQGAFQGATPKDAYFVKCDKETTTQSDINLGIVNILVGFAPLKPAEFVVLQIQQMAGQTAA